MNASKELRRKHVAAMRANFAIEDMYPDAEDLARQDRYIDGTVSLDELMNHARAYAAKHASPGHMHKPDAPEVAFCEKTHSSQIPMSMPAALSGDRES